MATRISDSAEQINCSSCLKYHLSRIDCIAVNDLLVNVIHISQYSLYQWKVLCSFKIRGVQMRISGVIECDTQQHFAHLLSI